MNEENIIKVWARYGPGMKDVFKCEKCHKHIWYCSYRVLGSDDGLFEYVKAYAPFLKIGDSCYFTKQLCFNGAFSKELGYVCRLCFK